MYWSKICVFAFLPTPVSFEAIVRSSPRTKDKKVGI